LIFIFLDSKVKDKRFCTEWQQSFPDFNDSWVLKLSLWEPNIFLAILVSPATELDSQQHKPARRPCGEPDHPMFRPRAQIRQNNTNRQINLQSRWHLSTGKSLTEPVVSPVRSMTEMFQAPSRDSSVARIISVWWDRTR
jgi:hypothetical protein